MNMKCHDCGKEIQEGESEIYMGTSPKCKDCATKPPQVPQYNPPAKFKSREERQNEEKEMLLQKFKEERLTMREFLELAWESAYDWGWTVRDEDGRDDGDQEPWDPHEMD